MKYKKIFIRFTAAIIAAISFFIFFIANGGGLAFAAVYYDTSDVLSDLSKDENFDISKYPSKLDDYGLYVMQIAESTDRELLLYVYQPAGVAYKFKATTARISLTPETPSFIDYKLTLLNFSGVFYKYKIEGLTVGNSSTRYYEISAIHRRYYSSIDIDKKPPAGQTIEEVAFKVGQSWQVIEAENGDVVYSLKDFEVISVTEQEIGLIRYTDGFKWNGTRSCDAHYFVFNADHKADNLLSADLSFNTQLYKKIEGGDYAYEKAEKHNVTLTYDQIFKFKGAAVDRMSSTKTFLNNSKIKVPEADKKIIEKYDWIFNFYETDYQRDVGISDILEALFVPFYGYYNLIKNSLTTRGTIVSEVTLLRLEFVSENQVYNLGVVSNKQTGSNKPNNSIGFWEFIWRCIVNTFKGIGKWYEVLVTVVVGVAAVTLVVLAVMFIKFIVRGLFK